MKIITLTINPAFDIHLDIPNFREGFENTVISCRNEAGGKGINTSRALCTNGIKSTAYFLAGRDNAGKFINELDSTGIKYEYILHDGAIRENITVHGAGGKETRLSLQGGKIPEADIEKIFDMVQKCADFDTILTFAGRLPEDVSAGYIISRLASLRKSGVKTVVDSSSLKLEDILEIKPWLIKPNREEIETLAGEDAGSESDIFSVACRIHAAGVEHVLVTLGGDGALYAGDEFRCKIIPPAISALSTIGAGDSSIAGFCAAYASGKTVRECLASAVAYGSAACLRKGTLPPKSADIAAIYAKTKIKMF